MPRLVQIGLAVSTLRSQLPFSGRCKPPLATPVSNIHQLLFVLSEPEELNHPHRISSNPPAEQFNKIAHKANTHIGTITKNKDKSKYYVLAILENGQSSFIFCCIGPQRALACNTQLSSIAVGVVIHCPIPCYLSGRMHCSCIVLG